MKKYLIIGLILTGLTSITYAAKDNAVCKGQNKFVNNLGIEQNRADKVQEILRSYSGVKDLYMSDRQHEIPEFLAQKEAELAAVLTPEELAQFKSDVAAWSKNKDFSKFMRFSSMGGRSHHRD
jgi:hypothetical protein